MTRKPKLYDIRRDADGNMTHMALRGSIEYHLPVIASFGKFFDDRQMGYCQWHYWAERMGKTHTQVRCPQCSLFSIWLPRKRVPRKKKEQTK